MSTQSFTLQVGGMDCAHCAQTIQTGVQQLVGVQVCELNFTTGKLRVQGEINPEQVQAKVEALGYEVVTAEDAAASLPPPQTVLTYLWTRPDTRLALWASLFMLPGLIGQELLQQEALWINLCSLVAMSLAGWPILQRAWRSFRHNREITINALMSIAAIGAVIIGAFTEAGMVMVLFALGEALEGYAADRARRSIRSLMEVVPQEATLLRRGRQGIVNSEQWAVNSGELPVISYQLPVISPQSPVSQSLSLSVSQSPLAIPVAELQIGDVILVKPGERMAMDGRVVAGQSAVNQAPITGESVPVDKGPGDGVFAGSINGAAALEVEVTHLAADNTISRVIQLVGEAQEKRAPAQRLVDQFARYYTPAVVVLALLVAVIPPLVWGQPFWNLDDGSKGWLYRGLALLVVACPCALVISTPVSLISAISNAARQGVLIKGGAHLEALSRIRAMAFDKTGTLTTGKPTVVTMQTTTCDGSTADCLACHELLALAGAVEQKSEHPLAQAVVAAANQQGVLHKYTAHDVRAMVGQGVTGQVNGQTITVGSHAYFEQHVPHDEQACNEAEVAAANGYTPLLISQNGQYQGTIAISDTVRPSSQEALHQLRDAGIHHLIMLTGDNAATAQNIAQAVGVTDFRANLLPEHKVAAVQALQAQYGPVAMVGDGLNDAPALATANVSIAIGAGGTAQALETADIALRQDDLRRLPFAVRLSQITMRTIWANIALSLGIKGIFLLLVLGGWGTMWLAVLADMGTSLLVTANGLRLLYRQA